MSGLGDDLQRGIRSPIVNTTTSSTDDSSPTTNPTITENLAEDSEGQLLYKGLPITNINFSKEEW